MLLDHFRWSTLTSTGIASPQRIARVTGSQYTMLVETGDSTTTVHFMAGLSSGILQSLGSTSVDTGSVGRMQFTGPFAFIAPRVEAVSNTNGVSVELLVSGDW